jgi:hypothetical protein
MENIAELSPSVASLANNECGGPELLPKGMPDTAAEMQGKDAQETDADSATPAEMQGKDAQETAVDSATPAAIACESKPASVETPPAPDLALPVLTERNNVMKTSGANPNRLVSPVLLKLRRKQERCNAISADTENPVLIVPPKKLSGFPAAERYSSLFFSFLCALLS